MYILKLLDLNSAFMKFSIKCKDIDVLASINHILTSTLECLRKTARRLSHDGIKKLSKLLAVPLESNHSLFDMNDFDGLILFLDYSMRKNLGLKIIQFLDKINLKKNWILLKKFKNY